MLGKNWFSSLDVVVCYSILDMIIGRRFRETLFSSLSYSYCFTRGKIRWEVGCEQHFVHAHCILLVHTLVPPLTRGSYFSQKAGELELTHLHRIMILIRIAVTLGANGCCDALVNTTVWY